MKKAVTKYGLGLLALILLSAATNASARQDLGDLGSSSGIFRAPNPKAGNKNKPTPAAAKPTSKKKTTAKPAASAAKNASPKTSRATAAKAAANKESGTKPKSKRSAAAANASKRGAETAGAGKGKTTQSNTARPENNASRQPENIIITVGQKNPAASFDEILEAAIEEGNAARDARDYAASEKAYRRAQSLKPGDARATYGLGNIFSDQQRWEEAEKAYRQAIAMEPDSPEAYIALSFVLTQPVSGVNLSERYAEAEKTARRAVELDAGNPVAFDQLGVALEMNGNISGETQEAYRTAIKLDPEFALAYAHLGRLLQRNGLMKESAAAYRDAIRLSTDVPTMILVAEVMQSQQRYNDSEQLLRRALRDDPKNPTALFLLGRALATAGNFDEAETLLKRSVEVSPNSFTALAQLASLYARRGNYPEAERTLMKAMRVVTPNERKRLAREFEAIGDGFMRLGKKQDAARVYRQALELDAEQTELENKLTAARKS
jgi:tetratricopeptide (TPR) repeat protein